MNQSHSTDQATAFRTISDCVREHALRDPHRLALCDETLHIDYATLDAWMDRVASALQRDGLRPGEAVGICAGASVLYAAAFLGALRAGAAIAPIAPSVTRDQFGAMLRDAQARICLIDRMALELLPQGSEGPQVVLSLFGTELAA